MPKATSCDLVVLAPMFKVRCLTQAASTPYIAFYSRAKLTSPANVFSFLIPVVKGTKHYEYNLNNPKGR